MKALKSVLCFVTQWKKAPEQEWDISTRTGPWQDQTSKGLEHLASFLWTRKTSNMWEACVHSKIHSILWWSLTSSITSVDPKLFIWSPAQNRDILFASRFLSISFLPPHSSLLVLAFQTALQTQLFLQYINIFITSVWLGMFFCSDLQYKDNT